MTVSRKFSILAILGAGGGGRTRTDHGVHTIPSRVRLPISAHRRSSFSNVAVTGPVNGGALVGREATVYRLGKGLRLGLSWVTLRIPRHLTNTQPLPWPRDLKLSLAADSLALKLFAGLLPLIVILLDCRRSTI